MGDGPVRARMTLEAGADASALLQALSPEAGREAPKTRTTLSLEGTNVVIDVSADDAGAMRAALNSYLRWAALAIDSSKLAKGD
ncbi:MAG: KEOPS complex subunit Pcc1 [Methanobacteriota archaeon]